VTGGEDERGLGAVEIGQLRLQLAVEHGVPGDQPRTGRARTPPPGRPGRGPDHLRVPGQPQVVVGGQVEQVLAGAARPQHAAEPGGLPLPGRRREPPERAGRPGAAPRRGRCGVLSGRGHPLPPPCTRPGRSRRRARSRYRPPATVRRRGFRAEPRPLGARRFGLPVIRVPPPPVVFPPLPAGPRWPAPAPRGHRGGRRNRPHPPRSGGRPAPRAAVRHRSPSSRRPAPHRPSPPRPAVRPDDLHTCAGGAACGEPTKNRGEVCTPRASPPGKRVGKDVPVWRERRADERRTAVVRTPRGPRGPEGRRSMRVPAAAAGGPGAVRTAARPGAPGKPAPAPSPDVDWIRRADRDHLWHPYASVRTGPADGADAPYVVTAASGTRLRMTGPDGAEHDVVDAMSSWWSAVHGYRHPVLDAALRDQLDRFGHVMFGGLTHEPAARLAALLAAIAPAPLHHVFLADSGSVSVEVALKMCLQYQRSLGRPERRRVLTWRGGYHGDTFHAMSVCDPEGGMHALWGDVLPRQVFADAPPEGFDAA